VSTDTHNASNESEIQSRLFTRIADHIAETDSTFDAVYEEKPNDAGFADIFVENETEESLVIETKAPDVYLLKRDHIVQVRDYADALGYSTFALCNENDFFLFDYNDEKDVVDIDFHYLNLREFTTLRDAVPKVLGAVRYLHHEGTLPNQEDKKQIIALLRSFHSSVYQNYTGLAKEKYGKNRKFTNKVDEWVQKNNYTEYERDRQLEILSQQFTYSLAIKILFYRILRHNRIGQRHDVPLNELGGGVGDGVIRNHIEQQFERVCEEINYEPIFDHKDTVFETFPSNKRGQQAIRELLDNFQNLKITDVNEDLLGQLYEELIPKDERLKLGQFYTPPSVAEAIVRWTLPDDQDELPRVLDPASGSGTFPVEIYKHMRNTYGGDHQERIDNISVVDINRFPLHLTGLNLAGRNVTEATNHIDSFHGSFFDYPEPDEVGKYDAVVGNPPYIDSDNLYPSIEHFRNHLQEYSPEGNKRPAYYNGTKRFSKQSDAYIYFITNAVRYLRDGGRLGFIVPMKWMETKYGEPFQQFLFDNVKVESVVTFGSRVFDDALVKSCLLLVEKCDDESERESNVTDFIHIKEEMAPADIVDSITYEATVEYDEEFIFQDEDGFSSVSMTQSDLTTRKGKLSYLLTAPKQVIELIESDKFTTLSECGEVSRGKITGANAFFFLDSEEVEQWGIDDQFVRPAIKSIRDVDSLYVTEDDVDRYLFDVHWFVEKHDLSTSEGAKSKLRAEGYTNVVDYIEYGETEGHQTKSKPKSRSVWFNLGVLDEPDLLHPKFARERMFTIVNKDKLSPSDAVDCITFEEYGKPMAAILNSTLYKIFAEVWGREEAGIIQMMTYELESIPVPDPSEFTDEELQALEQSYENIIEDDYTGIADKVIIDKFDLDITVGQLQAIHTNLVQARVGGAKDTTTLIRNADEIDEDVTPFEGYEDYTSDE